MQTYSFKRIEKEKCNICGGFSNSAVHDVLKVGSGFIQQQGSFGNGWLLMWSKFIAAISAIRTFSKLHTLLFKQPSLFFCHGLDHCICYICNLLGNSLRTCSVHILFRLQLIFFFFLVYLLVIPDKQWWFLMLFITKYSHKHGAYWHCSAGL